MAEANERGLLFNDLMNTCLPLKGACLSAPPDRNGDPSEDEVWSNLLQTFE